MTQVILHDAAINSLLRSPAGPVGREVSRRAELVSALAKDNVSEHTRTGLLQTSIHVELGHDATGPTAKIGSNVPYARYLELGTVPHPIDPVNAPFLESGPEVPPLEELRFPQLHVDHPGNEPMPYLVPALRTIFP